jgi:SnoaL-like domain
MSWKRAGLAAMVLVVIVAAVIPILGIGTGTTKAAASAYESRPVSAQARADIEELIASYANFWEFRYCDEWARLFTPDATFTNVGVYSVTGYAALVAKCEASDADASTHFHAQMNTMLVQVDSHHIRGLTNLIYGSLGTATAPAAILGYGDYIDLFVLTPGGWRFQSRSASAHKAQGLPPELLTGGY